MQSLLNTLPMDLISIPLPIAPADLAQANAFASAHDHPEKAKQVKLNTLAMLAMKQYLNLLQVPTSIEVGDAWSVGMQALMNVADLVLPGIGRLECRPVVGAIDLDSEQPPSGMVEVPAEVWHERIGHVVVQIDEAQQLAAILGYLPSVEEEHVDLATLEPIDALIAVLATKDYVAAPILGGTAREDGSAIGEAIAKSTIQLGQWFQNVMDEGWRSIDDLQLNYLPPVFRFKDEPQPSEPNYLICRGKVLQLDAISNQNIVLVVGVKPIVTEEGEPNNQAILTLYPVAPEHNLPECEITLRDEYGYAFESTQTKPQDETLELRVMGFEGEGFDLVIQSAAGTIVEKFML